MKSIFQNNQFEGFMVFTDKANWTNTLVAISEIMGIDKFFFFFDSERGNHLKIFSKHFNDTQIHLIQYFLQTLPASQIALSEDKLFKNVPENTIHRIKLIPKFYDIFYDEFFSEANFESFLYKSSNVIIHALQYNDFFIQEKNRMNFAIQLIFMALVRADKNSITQSLYLLFGDRKNELESNSPLISFYREVQQIESEEKVETWVLNWLDVSSFFLQKGTFQSLVESICGILEIRTFSPQLLLITQLVLNEKE